MNGILRGVVNSYASLLVITQSPIITVVSIEPVGTREPWIIDDVIMNTVKIRIEYSFRNWNTFFLVSIFVFDLERSDFFMRFPPDPLYIIVGLSSKDHIILNNKLITPMDFVLFLIRTRNAF